MRRIFGAGLLALLLTGLLIGQAAFAQDSWPQKQVRVVVPFPAGGSADALCRIVADKLGQAWKQPVIVDNRAGAGGNIGAETVYRAEPDGYNLLCSPPGPLSINHNLYKSLNYDWSKFVPISVIAIVPNVVSVRENLPAKTLPELVAYAKANPGKLAFASQGNGSTSHLSAEMLASQAGIKMLHVPYKGEGPALNDLIGGRVDLFFGNVSGALRFYKAGQLRLLAVASAKRDAMIPDVPSAPEVGLPDLIANAWFAFAAPPGTPEAIARKVSADTAVALGQPDVMAKFNAQGANPLGDTPAEAAAFIHKDEARWREVIKSANVTLE
jgi:tripartite-type tricarboxylate transporter receptor subunit TctC